MDYHNFRLVLTFDSSDCSAFDHCKHWSFDAAMAKTSWQGEFPKFGGVPPKKVPG